MHKGFVGLTLGLMLGSGVLGGFVARWAMPADPVEAQARALGATQLQAVDEAGRVRAMLAVLPDGTVGLPMFDRNDTNLLRAVLEVPANGNALLRLRDRTDKLRLVLAIDDRDQPQVVLNDRDGNVRIGVGVFEDRPDISILDENGRVIWSALRPAAPPPASSDASPFSLGWADSGLSGWLDLSLLDWTGFATR